MNRKAVGAICAAALALGTLLAGCAGGGSTVNVELSGAAGTVGALAKTAMSQDSIAELKNTYDIDSGDVKQFAAKHGDSARLVMVEAISDDAANRIEGKLQAYAEQNDGCRVVRHGSYIALFSGSNADKMETAFSGLFQAQQK